MCKTSNAALGGKGPGLMSFFAIVQVSGVISNRGRSFTSSNCFPAVFGSSTANFINDELENVRSTGS